MQFVRIGGKAINMENVLYVEEQHWHDTTTMKLYSVGQANSPMVLTDEDCPYFRCGSLRRGSVLR